MKTISVVLYELVESGSRDKTNRPIMTEVPTTVDGC